MSSSDFDSEDQNLSEIVKKATKDLLPKQSRARRSSRSKETSIRAVSKNGNCNIFPTKVPKNRFIRDIFTTLVDLQWRWTTVIFALGFFISWFIFGVAWWIIALLHGDLEEDHLPMNQAAANFTPCVLEVYGLMSCFLFSVETQHTTGYGQRTPTEECFEGVLLMCIQNIVGLIIEAFLVGIIFAKMTRPKLRTKTLTFSKCAVICQRDGILCLMFRIGDMRKRSKIIEAKIKAQLIRHRTTKEGETINYHQTRLYVSADECEGDVFFIWPMCVVHKINKKSPLYHLSPQDLNKENFEIIVTLEGTIESTDQKTQARSSYLSNEIKWGYTFEPVVKIDKIKRGYKVNYEAFDSTVAIKTPLCSADELAKFSNMQ
ncbi:hypothetical protein NQ315_017336 [Exocentrus adspersus]|uniref:Uncharacterized protein n=1 Tax=Exocentrus adspersus TaxID=1586481 RepID=A0AAV8VDV2_9CUCU|nr:hypothetical protein NQ315_017336 [Exocentrus adspersus]